MSAGKPVYYIQLYNQQHDPVFMELSTGKLLWTLPNENVLCNVLFVAHVSDDGRFYYENVDSNQVSWELPKAKMSLSAVDTAELVIKATRKVTEKRVGQPYDSNKSTQQMLTLDAYLQSKDELNKNPSSTTGSSAVNNPFLQGGMDSDEEEDSRNTFSRSTFSQRPSRLSLKTTALVKKNPVKSGYLMKLATVSGRNWKKRFFTLTSYYLAYYDDENSSNTKKPKGELQIVPDASVREETVDKKYGYGFRYANAVESIVLAASTEIDRAHWIQTIQSLIQQSATHLKAILTILPFSTVFSNQNLKNYFGSTNKIPARKYCILTDEVLSVHPTKETTTTIDAIININEMTKIDCVEQAGGVFIINLTDSDTKQSKLSIQFNSGIDDEKFYRLWKNKLMSLIYGDGNPTTFVNRPSATKNEANQKEEGRPVSVKAEVPKNVAVFGLSLDDDDDDDDGGSNPSATTSNVPFGHQRTLSKDDSDPSVEAKSNKTPSTNTSPSMTFFKRPSKPLGKSYLKMKAARASQSKERASVTDNSPGTATATSAAATPVMKKPVETAGNEDNNAIATGGGVFGMGFDQIDDDDDDNNYHHSSAPIVSNPAVSNPVNNNAALPPPPPPPPKKMESSELDSPVTSGLASTNPTTSALNPLASGRRRSVHVQPPSAENLNESNPAQSLFLQSLKQKTDHPFQQPMGLVDEVDYVGKPSQPPPPPVPAQQPQSNWNHPNSLHDFASNATPFTSNSAIQATRRRSGAEALNSTATVNAVEYGHLQLQPGEYDDPLQTRQFPSLLPPNDPHTIDLSKRMLSEMSLQEYLSTPMELRSSQVLDQIFTQPTDSFLQQTHQLLLQSKEQMKTLLTQNQNLLPLLSRHKPIVLEKKKSTFSLEKIEEYLQSHSIFSGHSSQSNASSSSATSQQLLQEKEIILNLLQFMKLSEQTMIQTIELYEAEALERIQNEGNHYKQELLQVEQTLKDLHQQHYQEIHQHQQILTHTKQLLKDQFDQFQSSQQESLQALVQIAQDLQRQQQQISMDRKKMLKQRYQLDVLLQDINDCQQLPTGMMNPSYPLPMTSPPMGMMYNNNNGFANQPSGMMMNPMMNYSADSYAQQQQQQQQRQAMMMMGMNASPSPIMMQELMNSSGGFPYSAPPTMNSSSSHFSNSLGSTNPNLRNPNAPSRSLSPNGRLGGIGANMTAAQAASLHYSNRSQSPHSMSQNLASQSYGNDMMQPPLPPDDNEMMMHVDELADHRVGRSRNVQTNNINAMNRGRSRSPGAAAVTNAPVNNVTPQLRLSNNCNLTKQQLLQHQMMQQQQQNQTFGNTIASTNPSSRGTSPSPYYPATAPNHNLTSATPAQLHNIQVNLNQIKKHSMANQHRKPFK